MTDLSGQVLADKYRIDSLMREGNLGSLYHGTHLSMEKPVAIKILPAALAVDDNIAKRFLAEAKTLSRISHPNILNVTDQGSDKNGTEFIVFENAEGQTLKDDIRADGKFSLERANRITRQIAAALSVAHTNGVIHKNLTAENILLTKTAGDTDSVKVLNFGIASADEAEINNEEVSARDAEYFSPEQCSGNSEVDARSDIYSLGVILYEMLAGEVPFTAEKPSDVMLKHVQEPQLPLSAFRMDVPNEVSQIILTALAKNPDSRYQNVNELAAELNRVTTSTVSATTTAGAYPNLSQPVSMNDAPNGDAQNNLWKTAFIVLAGIAVLGSFFIYMTQVKQTIPQTTSLITDANGQPVQPVNPPVGSTEQSLSNMGAYNPEISSNSTMMVNGIPQQQVMPGGDGYDPWRNGVKPPPGAPQDSNGVPMYVPPTGQTYDGSINPNSPFMAPDGNTYVLVPKNNNSNVNAQPKKNANVNANTQVQTPPAANTSTAKPPTTPPAANTSTPPTTQPKSTPAPKATATPKAPAKSDVPPSGKKSDTQD